MSRRFTNLGVSGRACGKRRPSGVVRPIRSGILRAIDIYFERDSVESELSVYARNDWVNAELETK